MSAEVTRELSGELAAFLRTRRERLDPADVALPDRGRPRRTPGLRREEVADLAGVSVDYVVRLEQGRGLHPSPEVLDALAGALRLSDDERAYLFALARQRPTGRPAPEVDIDRAVPSGAAGLVHDLSPLPAMLVDHRFDVHARNLEMAALIPGLGNAGADQRLNTIELCLLNPAMGDFYPDRELIFRESIADLRAAWATRPEDTELAGLIARWRSASAEFARLWELHDVQVHGRGVKRLNHPVGGSLSVLFEVLNPLNSPNERLVIYRAADAASRAVLDRITQGLRAVG